MGKPTICIGETKAQISFAVTAKLISAFVFDTWIAQFLYFLNPKFPTSNHLLCLHSLVCVGPGGKPGRPVFLHRGTFYVNFLCRYVVDIRWLPVVRTMTQTSETFHSHKTPLCNRYGAPNNLYLCILTHL